MPMKLTYLFSSKLIQRRWRDRGGNGCSIHSGDGGAGTDAAEEVTREDASA